MLENIDRGTEYLQQKIKRAVTKFNLTDDDVAWILFEEANGYYWHAIATRYLHNNSKIKKVPK